VPKRAHGLGEATGDARRDGDQRSARGKASFSASRSASSL
jgi:hypothetical protein